MKCIPLCALVAFLAGAAAAGQSKHKITVTFDYDFAHQPPCSTDANQKEHKQVCVQQFIVYDISAGLAQRTKLMTIPVPSDAHGMVKGLSGTSPRLLFESGQHLIAVVAQAPDGHESDPNRCEVWITIPDTTPDQH